MSAALRMLLGVVGLLASGLLLRAATFRLMRGVAMLFGAAVALVGSVVLIGSVVWGGVQRWRRRRRERPPA